jgi:hypothetical protein
MKILGLDGKEYDWKPRGSDALENKSAVHCKARTIIKEIFPFDVIMEEVELIGSRDWKGKKELTVDFYVPNRHLMIEAHGEQHYSYSSFFYKQKFNFLKAQKRDSDKARWCEQNKIELIVLDHKDKPEIWRQQIESRRSY